MKRVPLSQLSIFTTSNTSNSTQPVNPKVAPYQPSLLFPGLTHSKTDDFYNLEPNTTILDLKPQTQGALFDRIDKDMESPVHTPNKDMTPKSSLVKKSIKKERDMEAVQKSSKKLRDWLKLRQKRKSTSKTDTDASGFSLNMTYKFTPNKSLNRMMSQEDKIEEEDDQSETSVAESGHEASTMNRNPQKKSLQKTPKAKRPIERTIYCLNSFTDDVKHFKVGGLNIFRGDDSCSFTFPATQRTKKFLLDEESLGGLIEINPSLETTIIG